MKYSQALLLMLTVVTVLPLSPMVFGQPTQISSTVTLTYLNVQLSYPSEVLPTDTVTVNVQATAKTSFQLTSLSATIYYAAGTSLQQVASATIASNLWMSSGNKVNKDVQVTIPSDAPRTSLFTVVTEKTRSPTYDYYAYYYPYFYYYDNYSHYPYYYYAVYPTYYYTTTSDNAVAPLSYIKATTPEYTALQSQYENLQGQLNQTQAQNKQLQQQLQDQQNLVNQKNAQINDLNTQLNSAQTTIRDLEIAAVILVVVIIVVGLVMWRVGRPKQPEEGAKSTDNATKLNQE
jgi:hypothetical protein